MRHAARVDDCQEEIVKALRAIGVQVTVLKWPVDLLCAYRNTWYLLECKDDDGRLTKPQVEFIGKNDAPVHIVRSSTEALRVFLGDKLC